MGAAQVELNKKTFIQLEELASEAYEKGDYTSAIKIIKILAAFAFDNYSSVLYSEKAESILNSISEKYSIDDLKLELDSKKQVLHVLSEAYPIGGHSMMVKNWILNKFSNETHSIFLNWQNPEDAPKWLTETVLTNNGKTLSAKKFNDNIEKALYLRSIANNFDYVVFHIHPFDPLVNLAFGYKGCKTKRILLDNVDHGFWLGADAVDLIANLRSFGKYLSVLKRHSNKSVILNIVLNPKISNMSKEEARKKIGVDKNAKMLLSVARAPKYDSNGKVNFIETAKKIVNRCENCKLIVIGPSKEDKKWAEAYEQTKGKIEAVGPLDGDISPYHIASDLYLISFPIESTTACLEQAIYGRNIVRLDCGRMDTIDTIKKLMYIVKTEDEYIEKALYLLENNYINNELRDRVTEMHTGEGWRKQVAEIYRLLDGKLPLDLKTDVPDKEKIIDGFEKFNATITETPNLWFRCFMNELEMPYKKKALKITKRYKLRRNILQKLYSFACRRMPAGRKIYSFARLKYHEIKDKKRK